MKFGQMGNSYCKISDKADYLQFTISGMNKEEAIIKFSKYKDKNKNLKKIILHGDWTEKKASENNIETRYIEYINIFKELSKQVDVLGITIHPPSRKKVDFDVFIDCCNKINQHMNVFIENRSSKKFYLSKPDEIIEFSKKSNMTLDIPQLYISCEYDKDLFNKTLLKIEHKNIKEYHIANIKKTDKNCFVARKINDIEGRINYKEISHIFNKNSLFTLEIFVGVNNFEGQRKLLEEGIEGKEGTEISEYICSITNCEYNYKGSCVYCGDYWTLNSEDCISFQEEGTEEIDVF